MAMQWEQRSEIDREIDRQMGIGPLSTRPFGPVGPTFNSFCKKICILQQNKGS